MCVWPESLLVSYSTWAVGPAHSQETCSWSAGAAGACAVIRAATRELDLSDAGGL